MRRPEQDGSALPPSPSETTAYLALMRCERRLDVIQRSLGWRLLSYYGPYKRRFVLPAWRYVRSAVRRWWRWAPEEHTTPYALWARFADRFRGPVDGASSATLVSVIVTVDDASQRDLEALTASLLAQWHTGWELCVAFVDARETGATRAAVPQRAADDPRVRIDAGPYTTHTAATNAAIGAVRGEVVAFLPSTVALSPDALGSAVRAFADTAGDVLYGDEDLCDHAGIRHSPQLKPGWSPDLLLSWMYWSRLVFYRRGFLEQLGPLRADLEGAHGYDLALRATEQSGRLVHLPRILSHVRAAALDSPGALTPSQCEAARRALEGALSRRGIVGTVRWHPEGNVYRVQRTIARSAKVSIIIPTRDGLDMLQRCLRAVEATDHPRYEVLIVDNGSSQEATLAFLAGLATR